MAFIIVCLLLFAACGSQPNNIFVSTPDKGVTVENISSNPDDHIGKRVTVVAPVMKTFGEQVFSLHSGILNEELLAVGVDPYPDQKNEKIQTSLIQAKGVQVTGIVRRFEPAEIERETGVKLNDERLSDFTGEPVIVVKSLTAVR